MAWREQYDRMKRWQERQWLEPILHGDHATDSFYAFAQACYHLVDWLENDRSQPVRRGQAEAFVDASSPLAFCRDICNGSKHARLVAKKVRITSTKTVATVRIEDEEVVVDGTTLFVEWAGKLIDFESFAGLCVQDWEKFLRSEGLLK